MNDDTAYWIAQCARAISTREQCWYRPASIVNKGLTPIKHGQCAVFVTCSQAGSITCYRFLFVRLNEYPTPLLSRQDCQVQDSDGQRHISYWSVPGNVRDLGETIARVWLAIPS